jgi:fucose 4-O-acetylase-like acetyltransferase
MLSRKFRFLTFVCIVLLAYVHGYNLQVNYLTPYTTVEEPLTFTTFFEYLVANGLLRFRIPTLFIISGYLYALYDTQPYGMRIRHRFKTLMIPYLLWCTLALLFTFLLQLHPYTANIVYTANIDQVGENVPYTTLHWGGVLFRWLLATPAYQLWFIMALFCYNLLFPFIRWMLIKAPMVWLVITFLLWTLFFRFATIEGQGLFFFSLGAWIKISNRSIEKPPRWYSEGIAWIMFIGLCIIKTFLAFELEPRTGPTFFILCLVHQAAVICGVIAVWYSVDKIAARAMSNPWVKKASSYSFFLYGMHIPLLPYCTAFVAMHFAAFQFYRITSYLLLPLLIMALCLMCGWLLKKYWPTAYGMLAGGRGL